jgi:transcriptional regulator with XRE-family HTH domain
MHNNDEVHPIRAVLQRRWPPMSQAKLARELDVNPSVLSLYLKFKRTPPDGFYAAAAAVLGCDPDELRPEKPVPA